MRRVMLGFLVICGFGLAAQSEEKVSAKEIQRYFDKENLQSITSTALSPDGKFVYAAAYNSDTASVWKRDPETGKVTHVQTLDEPELDGLLALRVSPNGKYLAGASIKDRVTFFLRHPEKGELTLLDTIHSGDNGAGNFSFPIEVSFSKDSRFVYAGCMKSLEVFEIDAEGETLKGVQSLVGFDQQQSYREVELSPDGKFLYTAGNDSLSVFSINRETGKLAIVSELNDKIEKIPALKGTTAVACSPDNRHV